MWSPLTLAVLLLGSSCTATIQARPEASDLEVPLLDGTIAPWSSVVGDQGTTVVVFATLWCEICRRERPAVESWARSHKPSHRTVYVFSGGQLADATAQIQSLHLDTSSLTVVVDADGKLADHYGVESTPTLLVLGAQGQVLSTFHRFDALELN
jgi:thiol-disulfide isomerase/thioredoxin